MFTSDLLLTRAVLSDLLRALVGALVGALRVALDALRP